MKFMFRIKLNHFRSEIEQFYERLKILKEEDTKDRGNKREKSFIQLGHWPWTSFHPLLKDA